MADDQKFQIEFPQFGKKILANADDNLLELMRRAGITVDTPCGGIGRCGKCAVYIESQDAHTQTKTRRACMTQITEDMTVMLPHAEDLADYEILTEHALVAENTCEKASCTDSVSSAKMTENTAYAVAIDLGTTTLAAKLIDLSTGAACASVALLNAQTPYGADVISRIQVCMDDAAMLSRLITKQIDTAIAEMLRARNIAPEKVSRLVLAGNTSMSYILLGLPCRSLGLAPFLPAFELKKNYTYDEIFHTNTLFCPCFVLPFLSAYVGGDIAAGLFALRGEDDFILMDMGTNGELAFRRGDRLICTSTAAGPAFEGGNIECGTGSTRGAISSVRCENGEFAYETIGAAAPVGLCGSGILDLMAVLLREGMIDETGLMEESLDGKITLSAGGAKSGEARPSAVYFTQKDVRQFQLAKSAVRSGLEILIDEMGDAPSKVFLAGGFGQNLDPESAIRTGLLPEDFRGRVHAIGNSSLGGAVQLCMLSALTDSGTPDIQYIRALAAYATEINLAAHPRFNDLFIEYMTFE